MKEIQSVCNDRIMIQSPMPIWSLLELEMYHSLNKHGVLRMNVRIHDEDREAVFSESYLSKKIQIFGLDGEFSNQIFCGKIREFVYNWNGQVLEVEIHAVSYSIELEDEIKSRSFQNPALTYENVINQIVSEYNGRFLWRVEKNREIVHPVIQYEETNWDFLVRLVSHFHRQLQVSITTDKADIYIGINAGVVRDINEVEVIEYGIGNHYYLGGGYRLGHSKRDYKYIKVKHKSYNWHIGDFLLFQGSRFTIYERMIKFENGELLIYETLGGEGVLHQERIDHERLSGLQLQGIIAEVKEESVYIQLEIDNEERADYPWPWVPETGNLAYIMPEVGSRVILTMTTDRERDGIATHLLRENILVQEESHREFLTKDDKLLALHPEEILLRGETALIALLDKEGVLLKSEKEIQLNAQGDITLNSGTDLSVEAPEQVLLQNKQSNIELCKNINIFAPSGVRQKG